MVQDSFLPVKIHIKEQPALFERFGARWTPTQLVLDPEGVERHRVEGFLPADDFLAQLELALAKIEFEHKSYGEAQTKFHRVEEKHPKAFAAPEARYWEGVAAYKASNDAGSLKKTAEDLNKRYPESEWTRKASVWAA